MKQASSDHYDAGLAGSNNARAGMHNQRVILQAIRVNGPIIKPDLAFITGLTAPTVAVNIRRLLSAGLIREDGAVQGARGQPAMRYVVNASGSSSIGLNIDRDHITLVAVDFTGNVLARVTEEISFATPEDVTAFVLDQLRDLETSGLIDMATLTGIGVAIPDDLGTLQLRNKPKQYEVWSSTDLKTLFAGGRQLPVHVANDATAAAIGELQFGDGLKSGNFFYVLITSLLGGGLVVDGHPVVGAGGRSGEIGYLPIAGRTGSATLQDVVSLSGLYDHLQKAGFGVANANGLADLDEPAHAAAARWCDKAADLLSMPLMVVNATLNPDRIFIGGRLPPDLIERMCARLNARFRRRYAAAPSMAVVQRAALALDAAAMGAATLPFSDRFLPARSALLKVEN